VADNDRTSVLGKSATVAARVEPLRGRPSDETSAAFVPTGPSAERAFLQERLTFLLVIAWIASSGFVIMRVVLNAVYERVRQAPLERFPWFHVLATLVLFAMWVIARGGTLSERGLRRLDAWGIVAASFAYAVMEWTMPLSWRPDQLGLLIANAVLLGR